MTDAMSDRPGLRSRYFDEGDDALADFGSAVTAVLHALVKAAVPDSPARNRRGGQAGPLRKRLNRLDDVFSIHKHIRDFCPHIVKGLLSPTLKTFQGIQNEHG